MRRVAEFLIAAGLLLYGLLRVVVGVGLVGQSFGLVDIAAFHGPIKDVAAFLDARRDAALVHFTVAGYAGYIAVMGLALIVGAVGVLKDKVVGLWSVVVFLGLYAALFVNFQTVNRKVIHLGVVALLFVLLIVLRRGRPREAKGDRLPVAPS